MSPRSEAQSSRTPSLDVCCDGATSDSGSRYPAAAAFGARNIAALRPIRSISTNA